MAIQSIWDRIRRISFYRVLMSIISGAVMTVLALFLLTQPQLSSKIKKWPEWAQMSVNLVHELASPDGEEATIVRYTSFLKNILLKLEKKPPKEDFIFINIAYDKQLAPKLDSNGFVMGKEAITDRCKLANFLEVLASSPQNQRFVICDVFLESPLEENPCLGDSLHADARIAKALSGLPNALIPFHYDSDKQVFEKPFVPARTALANYLTVDGNFFKYQYIAFDTVKSLPMQMYEQLHGHRAYKKWGFFWLKDKPLFNFLILDFPIRQYDLFVAKEHYKVDNLENILSGAMTHKDILEYTKGRYVVIGDFEVADKHNTVYGEMGGTLILLNAYLALVNGDALISPYFLCFLYIAYALISYHVLSRQSRRSERQPWKQAVKQAAGTVLGLTLLSIGSYLIFNVHLSILYLSLYIEAMKWMAGIYYRRRLLINKDLL